MMMIQLVGVQLRIFLRSGLLASFLNQNVNVFSMKDMGWGRGGGGRNMVSRPVNRHGHGVVLLDPLKINNSLNKLQIIESSGIYMHKPRW
ncbi:hypothetical protein L1987_60104 [Smallanthus sonchifolius]|uniref:Uncharacterized protein n=1 Tax=Smallanthus sonchifolius TaxID=185202 RepID=A0ACB9D7Z1_9ASTR|nr:hypothetical protein L1987_60104 [Smallanthus sonchifolius]